MKKALFMLSVAAMTLASCSQEDVVSVNKNVADNSIAFRARTFKSSRAQDITTNNLDAFKVIAYKGYIDNIGENEELVQYWSDFVEFKRSTDPEDAPNMFFRSSSPYYYPTDGSWLTFVAYAPSTLDNVTSNAKCELNISNFVVEDNIKDQIDLIFADGASCQAEADIPDGNPDGSVGLFFEHALTKVYVSGAWNGNGDYKYEVAGVKFGNIVKKADYKFNKFDREEEYERHIWTPVGNELGDIEYVFETPVEIGTSNTPLMTGDGAEGSFLLIPQQLKAETLSADDADDGSNVKSYKFKEGVSYIALLLRITHVTSGDIIYPYDEGVEKISEEVAGKTYAWAAFPIGTLWQSGFYVDYVVDFSKGAGFVAPGAGYVTVKNGEGVEMTDDEGNPITKLLDYTPILGTEIKFFEEVWNWNSGTAATVDHKFEAIIDMADVEDPFGD